MRKVIDGKVYDTITADLLGEAESKAFKSDFNWWQEALYRTSRGAFFLSGEGYAGSSWAERVPGGARGAGSGIRVLTEAEAKEWAERYLDVEEYEEIWTPEEA